MSLSSLITHGFTSDSRSLTKKMKSFESSDNRKPKNETLSKEKSLDIKKALGMNYVRPPNLNFKKIKSTSDYIEYLVKTNMRSKTPDHNEGPFSNSFDSFIYCNDTLKIKMPKPQYMINPKTGNKKFAYIIMMFPNPKNGKASYLDGCLLAALGLRRQKTLADIVCIVTPDISLEVRKQLNIVFDKVIVLPYITPFKMTKDDIILDKGIFKGCPGYDKKHPYSHVFTKLHIFNPDLMPYEKIVFVDSDLVPLNYYDSLFMLDTPAGWVEYRKKMPYLESYHWDRCDSLEHGKDIPKSFTDLDLKSGADVNAGLLVITPSKKEYDEMIKELQSPVDKWMGVDKIHKGFWTFDFSEGANPTGSKFIDKSYCYPEQNYLTKRYSGKWKFLEFAFQSWSLDPCNSFGIHMAGFNPKPWFKEPCGLTIKTYKKYNPYIREEVKKQFLPLIIDDNDEALIYENITFSYEIFNDLIIWGLTEYDDLHEFFVNGMKIYGTKISFGTDDFKDLDPENGIQFKTIKEIKKGDKYYKRLSWSQKLICNLLNDYTKTKPKIKDNYLNICKSRTLDKYGEYIFDYQIVDYPDFVDVSSNKFMKYIKGLRMPFGRYKGKKLDKVPEEYIFNFINRDNFGKYKDDKMFLNALKKTKHKHLLKRLKSKSKSVSTKRTSNKGGKTRRGKRTRRRRRTR